jgi:hypothetical protein
MVWSTLSGSGSSVNSRTAAVVLMVSYRSMARPYARGWPRLRTYATGGTAADLD